MTSLEKDLTRSLELFVDAVERTSNLTIVWEGTKENGKDILVVEDSNMNKEVEGHQCEVDLSEIFSKVVDCRSAQGFIDVINLERKPVMLDGITRIVGYYSRTNNWNKSKIGELRDRKGKNYALSGGDPVHEAARTAAVNALS